MAGILGKGKYNEHILIDLHVNEMFFDEIYRINKLFVKSLGQQAVNVN